MALSDYYQPQLFNTPFNQLRGPRLYGQNSLAGNDAGLANMLTGGYQQPVSTMGAVSPTTSFVPDQAFGNSLGAAVNPVPGIEQLAETQGLAGGLARAASAEGPKAQLSAAKGGLMESLAPGLGWNMAGNFVSSQGDNNPYAKSILQGATTGGQLGAVAGIPGSVVGAAGGAAGQALTTGPGEWIVNQLRNPTNPVTKLNSYLNPLSLLARATGKFGTDVDSSQGGVVGLLKDSPLGGLLGLQDGQQQDAPKPTTDATTQNPDLNSRFTQLTSATKLGSDESQQLKDLYNAMRASGASDDDAWKATSSGALQAFQQKQQQDQTLGQMAALQNQVKGYMQPYADRTALLGDMQGQVLGNLASTLSPAYQGVFKYMADTAPIQARNSANAYMEQAQAVPSQMQQQAEAQQKTQWQNMINQAIMGQQLQGLKTNGQLDNSSAVGPLQTPLQ